MGNIKTTIDNDMNKLDELIKTENFEEARRKFVKSQNELKKNNSEEKKTEITNYLLDLLDPDVKKILKNYIWNLRASDRIYLIFKEIYEGKLLKYACNKEVNEMTDEKEINDYIERIEKVFKMLGLVSKISIINESLSKLYFKLVDIKRKKIQKNPTLEQINELINLQEKCLQCIKNSSINKEQRIEYENMLEDLLNIKNQILGNNSYLDKKYEEAIMYFNKITKKEEIINQLVEKCYEELVIEYEKSQNYEKALEALGKLRNNYKRIKRKEIELKMKILYQKINNQMKEKNYFNVLDLYYELLEFKLNDINDEKYFEQDFEKYTELFLSTLIKIILYLYKENNFPSLIRKLEAYTKKYTKQKILFIINSMLENVIKFEKDKNILSLENISKVLLNQDKLTEINQKIFLMLLIEYYLKEENKKKIFEILNNSKVNLLYLSEEDKNILYQYLQKEDLQNIDMIYLISNFIFKIINQELESSSSLFKIVGLKIQKLFKNKKAKDNPLYYDCIKLLMKIFQNIILKSNHNLKDPIIIYTNILFGLPKIRKEAMEALVSFSQNKDNVLFDVDTTYFFIDYILSKNEEIKFLLETILRQIEVQPKLEKGIILLLFKLLIFYKREKNDLLSQEKILKLLIYINIGEDILTDLQMLQNINEYLKLGNYCSLIFDFINKIPKKNQTSVMIEAYKDYLENQKLKEGDENIKDKKLDEYLLLHELKRNDIQNENQQAEIEEKLDDPEMAKVYLENLKSSNQLFETMNLKKVSMHLSLENLEIFKLICQNKKIWPEKALSNLLNGFYKENKNLMNETFKLFNLIEEYQKLPEIIIKNIEIEKKLMDESYYNLQPDSKIIFEEMAQNFNDLKGFSKRHKKFLKQITTFSFESNSIVYTNIINLIANKNFDIGRNLFIKCVQKISIDYFIKIYSKILSNPLINNNYKSYVLRRLDKELCNESNSPEQIKQLIDNLKYFIDWIILPQKNINTFYSLLNKYLEDPNIKKELIFSIGNYFSSKKEKQKESFTKFKELLKEEIIFKNLNKEQNNKFSEDDIFYIYSSAQYYDKFDIKKFEEIPINAIIKYIFEHQKFYTYDEVNEKIEKFNSRLKYQKFFPERDNILRKIYLAPEPKSLDYLEILTRDNVNNFIFL